MNLERWPWTVLPQPPAELTVPAGLWQGGEPLVPDTISQGWICFAGPWTAGPPGSALTQACEGLTEGAAVFQLL